MQLCVLWHAIVLQVRRVGCSVAVRSRAAVRCRFGNRRAACCRAAVVHCVVVGRSRGRRRSAGHFNAVRAAVGRSRAACYVLVRSPTFLGCRRACRAVESRSHLACCAVGRCCAAGRRSF